MRAKRGLIACRMVEDEVNAAVERKRADDVQIVWIDRGLHSYPEKLRRHLQEQIDLLEDAGCTDIMLAYGLCGRGTEGLVTKHARLAIPRYDDCLNFMLVTGKRPCRALCHAGIMYLTHGWSEDQGALLQTHEQYVEKYGKRRGDRIMHAMFDSYNSVCVIDNGCFEMDPIREYGRECADLLKLAYIEEPGSNIILEKLIGGRYDDDIIVCEPGRPITMDDFEFEPVAREA